MKKKVSATIRHTRVPIFNADVVLILCEWKDFLWAAEKPLNKEKYETLKKQVIEHGESPTILATQYPMGGGGSIIWANKEATVGTLIHELVHTAHYLLKQRATPLSEDTEEVYAYLIEYLFSELVKQPK